MAAPPTLLEEAQAIVRDRREQYGNPLDDFMRVGQMWGAILGIREVPPERVALCMMALKISRATGNYKRDNMIDVIGYADCFEQVMNWPREAAPTSPSGNFDTNPNAVRIENRQ